LGRTDGSGIVKVVDVPEVLDLLGKRKK
jgi:hypothetical protein